MSNILEILNLYLKYGKKEILHDISFFLTEGEVLALIGPSGGGKSTLLRAIALLKYPHKGNIIFKGKGVYSSGNSIPKKIEKDYQRSIGIVFQELNLWPHLSAIENITLPLIRGLGMNEKEARVRANELLERLSLEQFADVNPPNLSVGQQQRCAIARTLAQEPDILLLDEITSALDPELVSSILCLIKEIAIESNRTMIVVTHEMDFAKKVCDRIAFLENGCLIEIAGAKEVFEHIYKSRIRDFLVKVEPV